mmetsp:Transcript_6392/g.16289  ORF Transcript_6392/g.16289 Transcript_6392/m.16289 type:complete len:123 (-) Transcript_6392:248-616(-)
MDDQEAVFRVAQECGMEGIVPRQWVENITAVMPETGYVVRQPALLQDYVDGISLQALSRHKDKAVRCLDEPRTRADVVLHTRGVSDRPVPCAWCLYARTRYTVVGTKAHQKVKKPARYRYIL